MDVHKQNKRETQKYRVGTHKCVYADPSHSGVSVCIVKIIGGSWYPKLWLCCPAAWPRQSSAAGDGATEALQSSPEDDAPTLEGRSGPLAQTLHLSQLQPRQKHGLTADWHTSPSSWSATAPASRGMGQRCRGM